MFSRIHSKLGTAGLIVAVIALVAALAGTAFAAAKLNGTQKKEVKKIAQQYAGKPGAPGAQGLAGPKGDKGDKGDAGSKGDTGTPGANGKSVVTGILDPGEGGCIEGGVTVEVEGSGDEISVCNGEEGEQGPRGAEGDPWVAGTVPSGKVMEGTWVLPPATAGAAGEEFLVPISTSVPINQSPELFVFEGGSEFCSGSAEDPDPPRIPGSGGELAAGAACIYKQAASTNIGPVLNTESKLRGSGGGFVAAFNSTAAGSISAYGSWAIATP